MVYERFSLQVNFLVYLAATRHITLLSHLSERKVAKLNVETHRNIDMGNKHSKNRIPSA